MQGLQKEGGIRGLTPPWTDMPNKMMLIFCVLFIIFVYNVLKIAYVHYLRIR